MIDGRHFFLDRRTCLWMHDVVNSPFVPTETRALRAVREALSPFIGRAPCIDLRVLLSIVGIDDPDLVRIIVATGRTSTTTAEDITAFRNVFLSAVDEQLTRKGAP